MKLRIHLVLLLLSLLSIGMQAQWNQSGRSYKLIKGTTVNLQVEAYRGNLQWQYSYDQTNWNTIENQTDENYSFPLLSAVYIRAGVQEAACDWLYSDWIHYIPISVPELTTYEVSNIGQDTAHYSAELTADGNGTISKRGICYGTSNPPDLTHTVLENNSLGDFFWGTLRNLDAHTTYFLRAFAENEAGIGYGNTVRFETPIGLPKIVIGVADPVTQTTAVLHANILSDGGAEIETRGFCWGINPLPDLGGSFTETGSGTGEFHAEITGLNPATSYFFRAFTLHEAGLTYSDDQVFTTGAYLPTLGNCTLSEVTATSAKVEVQLTDNGFGTINSFGICWSTQEYPTTADNTLSGDLESGVLSQTLTQLERNTSYSVRAYASNQAGLAYGEPTRFTTLEGKPRVQTGSYSQLTDVNLMVSGKVTSPGDSPITETGICWSNQPNPDKSHHFLSTASPINEFNLRIVDLLPQTTYYFRAFAANAYGEGYGETIQINTRQTGYYLTEPTLTETTRNSFKGWSGVFPDFGSNGNGFSGITCNWDEDEIYIIGNNAKALWVARAPGSAQWTDQSPGSNYKKTIPLYGYADPEAVSYLGNGWIMIGDESLRQVSFTKITAQTTSINKNNAAVRIDPTALFSSAVPITSFRQLEGIAYDFHNKILYGLCEIGTGGHPRLFAWNWDFENQKIDPGSMREVTGSFAGLSNSWEEGSDLHYSALLKRLYVVSGADDRMAEYHCPHPDEQGYGTLISNRQLPRSSGSTGSNLGDCEGICISADGSHVYLCFENESVGYAPLPFVRFLSNNNLPAALYPFQ